MTSAPEPPVPPGRVMPQFLPPAGVLRIAVDPARLPRTRPEARGPNRFDDPRPSTQDRYVMRYAASSVRGCLLELLDGWRPNELAAQREEAVVDDDYVAPPPGPAWAALDTYLAHRGVAVITSPSLPVVSINDPQLQATLDHVAAVRALLDGDEARSALLPAGADPRTQVRLDGAAVRLASDLGRDLTRTVSLVLHDLHPDLGGIHYRSRHDDTEDCWAIYGYAPVHISDSQPLTPDDPHHRSALTSVAAMWHLDLPPQWNQPTAPTGRRGGPPTR